MRTKPVLEENKYCLLTRQQRGPTSANKPSQTLSRVLLSPRTGPLFVPFEDSLFPSIDRRNRGFRFLRAISQGDRRIGRRGGSTSVILIITGTSARKQNFRAAIRIQNNDSVRQCRRRGTRAHETDSPESGSQEDLHVFGSLLFAISHLDHHISDGNAVNRRHCRLLMFGFSLLPSLS